MALDQYALCPCGSGKKFKWCCQAIYPFLEKAIQQDAAGQHEAALQTVEQMVAAHPTNPEVWGRKAQFLYQMERVEEAENALEKAFELNPDYPFGHFLRGRFRQFEGELLGALLQFRKASELFAPEAHDFLSQIFALITDCELKLNRPVAAHAALIMALRHAPKNPEFLTALKTIFGAESQLPQSARREYVYQSAAPAPAERKTAWEQALGTAQSGRLTDAARAFTQLTLENAADAAAWYNLGLTYAWMGNHVSALEALDRYMALETDAGKAASAWALGEVLRFGYGMEEMADHVKYLALLPMRQGQPALDCLSTFDREHRLLGTEVRQEENTLTTIILEKVSTLAPNVVGSQIPRLGASLLVAGNMFHLSNTNRELLEKIVSELRQRAGAALGDPQRGRSPANFMEVLSQAMVFPVNAASEEDYRQQTDNYTSRYFEEQWIHKPLLSLERVPPVDAAGHGTLRKKLAGVILFLEDCGRLTGQGYDFNRLRRKLGLSEPGTASVPTPTPSVSAPAPSVLDIGALSAAELATLSVEPLSDTQVEEAFQTALKLDARELAGRFAKVLVSRPAQTERPDRFRWFAHLIQQAVADNTYDAALDFVNEGTKDDCEHNEGRRRNDYELRRGQIHAKRGDMDEAQSVFDKLIERVPSELAYRSTATETMLSAKQGARARRFAEEGLAKARQQNNRDLEEHFKELLSAAQRQSG